jgi:large subunit ribosomal protein L15
MAEKKTAAKKAAPKKAASAKSSTKAAGSANSVATASGSLLKLGELKPAKGSWPKRQRIGRGHGSGMVKTGGEGGKGQTVRSGGGKGPAFEGGQTPWARRLPQKKGVSQKARDIGHFRTEFHVVNVGDLAGWDTSVEVSPQSLKDLKDGVKILGGSKKGGQLPTGLKFRDVLFSATAREALGAVGADFGEAS